MFWKQVNQNMNELAIPSVSLDPNFKSLCKSPQRIKGYGISGPPSGAALEFSRIFNLLIIREDKHPGKREKILNISFEYLFDTSNTREIFLAGNIASVQMSSYCKTHARFSLKFYLWKDLQKDSFIQFNSFRGLFDMSLLYFVMPCIICLCIVMQILWTRSARKKNYFDCKGIYYALGILLGHT